MQQQMRAAGEATTVAAPNSKLAPTMVTALLACGVAATVGYIAMDVAATLRYGGYSYVSQTISELSAVGAPTRPMWLAGSIIYELLVIAFGSAVVLVAGNRRGLRIAGALLVVMALVGIAWPFAPMHQREVLAAGGGTLTDTMHLVLAGVDVVLTMLIIGLGAGAFGARFRVYSFVTIAATLVFGAWTGIDAPRVSDNATTPGIGIAERITVYGFMTWFAVLAIVLILEAGRTHAATTSVAGIAPGRTTDRTQMRRAKWHGY